MEQDVVQGTGPVPTEPASNANAQPSAIDYTALAKALEPVIADRVERQWQSGKDKRIADLTGKVDGFQSQLERYLQYAGQNVNKDALRQMKIDELLEGQSPAQPGGNVSAASNPAGTGNAQPNVDVETLQALDLDPNSPEVKLLLEKDAAIGEYINLVKRRKAKPVVQPAAVMSAGSGGTIAGESAEELTQELQKLYNDPRANMAKISEISKKLEGLLPRT